MLSACSLIRHKCGLEGVKSRGMRTVRHAYMSKAKKQRVVAGNGCIWGVSVHKIGYVCVRRAHPMDSSQRERLSK